MLIQQGCCWAQVRQASAAEQAWLIQFMRFGQTAPGQQRSTLLDPLAWRFPAGLLPLVQRAGAKAGLAINCAFQQGWAEPQPADLSWLRADQLATVEHAIQARRGIVWLPTGAGKTEIAIAIVQRVPGRWLLLVHRRILAEQAAERYRLRTGEQAGLVSGGTWDAGRRLTCGTFQTVHRALRTGQARAFELLRSMGGIMPDEAHTIAAGTFWACAMGAENAHYRIGLSGTPLARSDHRSALVVGALGPIIVHERACTLIDQGILARPTVVFVPCRAAMTTALDEELGGYAAVYRRGIADNDARNQLLARIIQVAEKPTMVFVRSIRHGRMLDHLASCQGLRGCFVAGSWAGPARQRVLRDLQAGRLDYCVATNVFQEGIDVPALRSIVVASADRSAIAALQRAGRALRVEPGKTAATIWDIDDQQHPWLARAAQDRRATYLREHYPIETRIL